SDLEENRTCHAPPQRMAADLDESQPAIDSADQHGKYRPLHRRAVRRARTGHARLSDIPLPGAAVLANLLSARSHHHRLGLSASTSQSSPAGVIPRTGDSAL